MYITSGTNDVAQHTQNDVSENAAPTPSCLNNFLVKIIDIITLGFLKKNKDDDYKNFSTDFTSNLLNKIKEIHNRNNSYHIPHHIEFEYLNNTVIFNSDDKNTKETQLTTLIIATQQGERFSKTISTEIFSQFCKIQLAIQREILTEDEISFTSEGLPDLNKMNPATESLLTYILSDDDHLETQLHNAAPKPVPPRITENTTSPNNNFQPAQTKVLQPNKSSLYPQSSRKTSHNESTINQRIIYTKVQKKLEETINNIAEKLKRTYSKDSVQRRSTECDGLFRISGKTTENKTALDNLKKCALDIDKTHRDTLIYVLKETFSKINPINEKVLLQMIETKNEPAKILYEEIKRMGPIDKKLFLIILGFYSDAYQSADDSTTSMFNKKQLRDAALRITILPNLYDCIKETPLNVDLIKKRNDDGDRIVSSILTSFSYANGSVQLKTNGQECANLV